MPYNTDRQESSLSHGIVLTCVAARNLPENATIEKLTQLFDAAGLVANIKLLDKSDDSTSRTAIVAYYSDETARRALQELDGNMALSLSHPIALEYLGPSDIKQAEIELAKREQAAKDLQANAADLQKILDSVNLN